METKSSSTDSILKLELQLDPLPLSTDGVKEACRDCVILVHGEFKPSLGSLSMCGTKGGATRTSPLWRSGAVVERSGTHQVSTGGLHCKRYSPVFARRLLKDVDLRIPAWCLRFNEDSLFLGKNLSITRVSCASIGRFSVGYCEHVPMFVRLFDF